MPVYVACVLLALAVAVSISAPLLAPHDPNALDLSNRLLPPAWEAGGSRSHLLGTDALGHDVLSRVLYGGRITLLVAVAAVVLSAVFGTAVAIVGGYHGGLVDNVLMRIADVQLAVPAMLLAITLIAIFSVSLQNVIAVLTLTGWVPYARVIRSQVLSLKEREFVDAARAIGATKMRVMRAHVFPNVSGTCLVLATLALSDMMMLEASLSFLGLGVRTPEFSWGSVMGDGRDYLSTSWWIVTFPGIAISAVVLSTNLVGDALRDRLDPGLRA